MDSCWSLPMKIWAGMTFLKVTLSVVLWGLSKMKILLHICCANCAIYPLERIGGNGEEAVGFFFHPNIHPYQEYQKDSTRWSNTPKKLDWRWSTGIISSGRVLEKCVPSSWAKVSVLLFDPSEATAREARDKGFDAFSTTLLQSSHQITQSSRKPGSASPKR